MSDALLIGVRSPGASVPPKKSQYYVRLGARIRAAREAANITQSELAERIGVTSSAVTMWEGGARAISIEYLDRLARVLDRPLQFFLPSETTAEPELEPLIEQINREAFVSPKARRWVVDILAGELEEWRREQRREEE